MIFHHVLSDLGISSFLMSTNTCSPKLGVRPPSVRLEHNSSLPAPVRTGNDQTSRIYTKCSMKDRITSNLLWLNCVLFVLNVLKEIPTNEQTQWSQYKPPRSALTADSTESTHTSIRKLSAILSGHRRMRIRFHLLVHCFTVL